MGTWRLSARRTASRSNCYRRANVCHPRSHGPPWPTREAGEEMNFASDNAYGALPEIWAALQAADRGTALAYGNDAITKNLKNRFAELFERDVAVFPVLTGTAANALALACLTPPYGAVLCHRDSHIMTSECGAPGFFLCATPV